MGRILLAIMVLSFWSCSHTSPQSQVTAPQRQVASPECSEELSLIDSVGCWCADPSSQIEINMCSGARADLADKALNHVYDCLLETTKSSQRSVFEVAFKGDKGVIRQAQKAWITYKDTACSYETHEILGEAEGSLAPTLVAGCRSSQTLARLNELLYLNDALGLQCRNEENYLHRYTSQGQRREERVNIKAELAALGVNPATEY